jgi:hypothetical protein
VKFVVGKVAMGQVFLRILRYHYHLSMIQAGQAREAWDSRKGIPYRKSGTLEKQIYIICRLNFRYVCVGVRVLHITHTDIHIYQVLTTNYGLSSARVFHENDDVTPKATMSSGS